MMEKELKAGIGNMKFARGEGSIIIYALGSRIGVALYNPFIHLGALLHIMLPPQFNYNDINAFKYADSGIRETARKLTVFGMVRPRMVVEIVEGAKMFEISGNAGFGNTGTRNIANVKKVLLEEGMCIAMEDIGGSYTRTMKLDLSTGSVTVRTFGRPEKILQLKEVGKSWKKEKTGAVSFWSPEQMRLRS